MTDTTKARELTVAEVDAIAERWRRVPGTRHYDVSSLGRVRSWIAPGGRMRTTPLILRPLLDKAGYASFREGRANARLPVRTWLIHRAVLIAFEGPPPTPRHQADHANGVRHDNRLCNLRWLTPRENTLASGGITAALAARSACKRGHELTPTLGAQPRRCRECRALTRRSRNDARTAIGTMVVSIACPDCGAARGQKCGGNRRALSQCHAARFSAIEAAAADAARRTK